MESPLAFGGAAADPALPEDSTAADSARRGRQLIISYVTLWAIMIPAIIATIAILFILSIFIDAYLLEWFSPASGGAARINPHNGTLHLPMRNAQMETFIHVGTMVSATYLARFQLEDLHRSLHAKIVKKVE